MKGRKKNPTLPPTPPKKVQPPVWKSKMLSARGMCLPEGLGWDRLLWFPLAKEHLMLNSTPTPGSQNGVNIPEPGNGKEPGSTVWVPTPTAFLPRHHLMAQCPPRRAGGQGCSAHASHSSSSSLKLVTQPRISSSLTLAGYSFTSAPQRREVTLMLWGGSAVPHITILGVSRLLLHIP